MTTRIARIAVAAAAALGAAGMGLALSTAPADAAPAHCAGWTTHPDLYSGGGISFGNGTYLRTGPYSDCPANGQGFPSHGIDVHCAVVNTAGNPWLYVEDTTTGERGWARYDAMHYSKTVTVPVC